MISENFRINQDVTFICQVKMYHANYTSKWLKANAEINTWHHLLKEDSKSKQCIPDRHIQWCFSVFLLESPDT